MGIRNFLMSSPIVVEYVTKYPPSDTSSWLLLCQNKHITLDFIIEHRTQKWEQKLLTDTKQHFITNCLYGRDKVIRVDEESDDEESDDEEREYGVYVEARYSEDDEDFTNKDYDNTNFNKCDYYKRVPMDFIHIKHISPRKLNDIASNPHLTADFVIKNINTSYGWNWHIISKNLFLLDPRLDNNKPHLIK